MNPVATSMFDRLAADYDDLWTSTTIGRLQRDAVWRQLAPLFQTGQRVLDIGCGTGEDARWLGQRGIRVVAIDASVEMVKLARHCGVDARVCDAGNIEDIAEQFDGAISNFGALNCVPLAEWSRNLSNAVRPGGYLAVCVIGRFCLWETVWYTLHGQFRKATRRWSGETTTGDLRVQYPTVNRIAKALSAAFRLVGSAGIGIFVPPSYVGGLPDGLLCRLGAIDASVETLAPFRLLADHRLLIFQNGRED